ncbi:MAG: helix-hairpin-helix domain-containing protein [Defluviitaleaceae bacterium]|nr:helix-hairpin-helix domain-containing protein [Defluviitaleaceae bacterium]MCL2273456.1 helix-hairpin-helix domain-containing protein [Defluviitaleaceae bacterium]
MKEFLKQHVYIFLGIACIIFMGVLFITRVGLPAGDAQPERVQGVVFADDAPPPEIVEELAAEEPPATYYVIHILGAVYTPGVFQLPANTRIVDAVKKAGGYTKYADLTRLNLAAPLRDAMQIIVPTLGDYTVEVITDGVPRQERIPAAADDGLICLNTASLAELQTLPNIGPARAQSIIDYRETHGGFTRVEELLNISGIGNTIFERLRPLVIVR